MRQLSLPALSLLALAAVMPAAAQAETVRGLYVGAALGVSVGGAGGKLSGAASRAAGTDNAALLREPSGNLNLSLGYGFGNGLRTEVELFGVGGTVDEARLGRRGKTVLGDGHGTTSTGAVMFNALYDIPCTGCRLVVPVQPYVGLGVGPGWSSARNAYARNAGGVRLALDNNTESVVVGQLIGGLAWSLDSVTPGLALTTETRLWGSSGGTFTARYTAANGTISQGKLSRSEVGGASLIGLRYAFQ